MTSVDVQLAGEPWRLLGAAAALHVPSRTLVVADVHLGKAATFRALGVPVPQGTTTDNLRRLTAVIESEQPLAIVFLGDLFHAREAHAPATLARVARWRGLHPDAEIVVVEGNHDRKAGAPPAALRAQVVAEPWPLGAALLAHHPQRIAGRYVVAGHLHPNVVLYGAAYDSLRLPCFWLADGLAILPAFGDFTGGARIERADGDRVFAVAEGKLFEVPARRPLAAGA